MQYSLWAAKGGSGCTTVAVTLAAHLAARGDAPAGVLLVDLGGDIPAATGLADPSSGVTDWLAAPAADDASLRRLELPLGNRSLHLLPLGRADSWSDDRTEQLRAVLRRDPRHVVVDAGTLRSSATGGLDRLRLSFATGDASYLVTRACYLSLRRAMALPVRPSGVVLLREQGRGVDRHDVRDVIGVPVIAELDHDPLVARSVDAGLLVRSSPRAFGRQVRRLAPC